MDKIRTRKVMLSLVRLRFASEAQPIRENVIDKIIEKMLFLSDISGGVTADELCSIISEKFKFDFPVISIKEIKNSFNRLKKKKRARDTGNLFGQRKYFLEDDIYNELQSTEKRANKQYEQIVKSLFKDSINPGIYSEPFLECLSLIFSQLCDNYIKVLLNRASHKELFDASILESAITETKKRYPHIIVDDLKNGTKLFFESSEPAYDEFKWNMAQDYYMAKALGFDEKGQLLSKEIFGGCTLYLDTNILFPALEPKAEHHQSFKALSKVCGILGISLNVCQITLDELRRVVQYHKEILPKAIMQIPRETENKIRSIFFEVYKYKRDAGEDCSMESIFSNFEDPYSKLLSEYNIQLSDDEWFIKEESTEETENLIDIIIENSKKPTRPYDKTKTAAMHDSLILRWIDKEEKELNKKTLLVTLDTLLPGLDINGDKAKAITLDALLQWLSPMLTNIEEDEERNFTYVYSMAIKKMLFPKEIFFKATDFLIFSDLDYSCKELPPEDVEQCLRYIKSHASNLDLTKAGDREKISREIAGFFADPGRKFKKDLISKEEQIATMKKETLYKEATIAKKEQMINLKEKELQQRDNKINKLEEMINGLIDETQNLKQLRDEDQASITSLQKLRLKDRRNLSYLLISLTSVLFLAFGGIITYLLNKYGDGDNLLQKIINGWPLCAVWGTVFAGLVVGIYKYFKNKT